MVSVFAFVAVVYGINLAGAERFPSLLLLLWCMALTLLALSHPCSADLSDLAVACGPFYVLLALAFANLLRAGPSTFVRD